MIESQFERALANLSELCKPCNFKLNYRWFVNTQTLYCNLNQLHSWWQKLCLLLLTKVPKQGKVINLPVYKVTHEYILSPSKHVHTLAIARFKSLHHAKSELINKYNKAQIRQFYSQSNTNMSDNKIHSHKHVADFTICIIIIPEIITYNISKIYIIVHLTMLENLHLI